MDALERLMAGAEQALLYCAGDADLSELHRTLVELRSTLTTNSSVTDTLAAIRGALALSTAETVSVEFLTNLAEFLAADSISDAVLEAAQDAAQKVVTDELQSVLARAKARVVASEGSTSADTPEPSDKPSKLNRVLQLE